jgi:hypothetical protein
MDGFSVSSRLTVSDWRAYLLACTRRTQGRGWRGATLVIGTPVFLSVLIFTLMHLLRTPVEGEWLSIGILVGYGAILLVGLIVRSRAKPLSDAAFLGDWTFDFSPLGIRIRRPNLDSTTSWPAVREIASSADHIFIWIDSTAALLVPIRDLPAGLSGERAQTILNGLKSLVCAPPGVVDPGVAAPVRAAIYSPERAPQPPRTTTRSMQALLRWLTWRPFDGRALNAPDLAIALVSVLCFALPIGLDRIGVGPNAEFSYFGAQVLACKALALMGLGWIIWRATDPQPAWRAILFILGGLTLFAVPVRWGIGHLDPGTARWVASWSLLAVQLVYLARALRVVSGHRQQRAVAISLLVLLAGSSVFSRYLNMGPFWYVPEQEASNSYDRDEHEAERLLMSQPARIDAAVASMAPRSGDMSMYMVGFAGVGEQKVFAGEISLAAKVIGKRYGTQPRTLLLVNDRRDLEAHPLASVTGLKIALADIGRRMDRERDALVLVISSHGSKEPAISVSNGGIPLNDLTGKDLKEALDGAGIRWRVVIISACHAGAFIPYLSDDRSIVITAAAADRTSFGCSNDRDLTNFGEAFIRDALPEAPSIRAAFEKARDSIAAREHSEGLTPSMPTAYFGAAMEHKLEVEETSLHGTYASGTP